MRYLTIFLIAMFLGFTGNAQTYEVGGFLGGSNFIGDVGSTTYISPNKPAYGGVFKWNRSNRHSFRFTAIFSELEARDADSHEGGRQSRDYSFTNSIQELSLGLEFTFWEYDLFKDDAANAPYLYSGITVFGHDNLVLEDGALVKNSASFDLAIPIVLGYKVAVGGNIILALEAGVRYTFSDSLDGSDPIGNDEGIRFGNLNNDDWYMFTGMTVSFAFGRKPCYCAF